MHVGSRPPLCRARRWPDGKAAYYEYDPNGSLTALTGPSGGTTYYQYNARGQIDRTHAPSGGWAYYDYDQAGNCTRRHNPNGTLAYFSYDGAGRIAGIRNLRGDMSPICYFDYSYDAAGLITSIEREGGITVYYEYDQAERPMREAWQGPAGRASLFDSDGLTYFTWDGIRVLKTEDGSGTLKQRQVHGYAAIVSVGDIAVMESGGQRACNGSA